MAEAAMRKRIALGLLALSVIANLSLAFFRNTATATVPLCIQPIALFGPSIAFLVLLATDRQFLHYFTRPFQHKVEWLRVLSTTGALALLSLLVFRWTINDPTGELEAASLFWGHPLPWLSTGHFYAGFAGQFIRSSGGYAYIFRDTPWFQDPRLLLQGLGFDLVFYFSIATVLIRYWPASISEGQEVIEAA
jgi:hypothetical protein